VGGVVSWNRHLGGRTDRTTDRQTLDVRSYQEQYVILWMSSRQTSAPGWYYCRHVMKSWWKWSEKHKN